MYAVGMCAQIDTADRMADRQFTGKCTRCMQCHDQFLGGRTVEIRVRLDRRVINGCRTGEQPVVGKNVQQPVHIQDIFIIMQLQKMCGIFAGSFCIGFVYFDQFAAGIEVLAVNA